jgi:hypothetical protein
MMSQGQTDNPPLAIFIGAQSLEWTFDPASTGVYCKTSLTKSHRSGNANIFSCNVTGYLAPHQWHTVSEATFPDCPSVVENQAAA